MDDTARRAKYERQRKYYRTDSGRAAILASVYRKIDKSKGLDCDIDSDYLIRHIVTMPCIYCGTDEDEIGCDRIDNSKGHNKSNVVPCCAVCNAARMDNFSHEEMRVIGEAVARVRAARKAAA